MKIIHYFLGFPPYRSGGMTRLAYDLMITQAHQDNEVIALWPSAIRNYDKNPELKKSNFINRVKNVEIINPLPVPLMDGIKDIYAYTKNVDKDIYRNFLLEEKPDIIHIHTLMGLHREFIEVAKELNIKIVYTSHDFFGICSRTILFKNGEVCRNDHCCRDCNYCNRNALSLKEIKFLQSSLYRKIKNSSLVTKLRKVNRSRNDKKEIVYEKKEIKLKNYEYLRNYYIEMFRQIDCIHFNSQLTKKVYSNYFTLPDNRVISLSHKDILNRKQGKKVKDNKFRFLYLGPAKTYKGFNFLMDVLDELYREIPGDFELQIFTHTELKRPYLKKICESYTSEDLEEIFKNGDILIAPSQWYETFGFTVLESLSYNTPVIVSSHVGAKDIIDNCGYIYEANNKADLLSTLKRSIDNINELNINTAKKSIKDWKCFVEEINILYKDIMKRDKNE